MFCLFYGVVYDLRMSSLQSELTEEKAISKANVLAREELTAKANKTEAEATELREQVRDLTFFVEATSAIQKNPQYCELQGGHVEMPTPPQQTRKSKGHGHKR